MQKATPVILVLILLASALILSLRNESGTPSPAPATDSGTEEAQAAQPQAVWAQDNSDIPADEQAVFGQLENGMRYIIYPNAEPPQRVSVRLHIKAGSLMEDDDQRGLAHFLEHMVFNGTRNYKAEELIPKMQRLGISFGAHANAYTSFDETVYMLDLPDLKEETLNLAFTVMRDFGDGALLAEEEIEKERGVILAEKLSRDTVGFRLMQQQFEHLMPNSKISHRFPIGVDEVIENAPRKRFTDFYESYYIPERMTFIVVGDVDPEEMEAKITQTFASMVNPENPGADPDLGAIEQPSGIETAVFQDAEVTTTEVALLLTRPHTPSPDTTAKRLNDMKLSIANAMLSRRFDLIKKQKDSPLSDASAYKSTWFNAVDFGAINLTAADDRWQEVVPLLENEFRKAMQFGFDESELQEAKSNILNAARQAVQQKDTRKSEALASMLARSLNDGDVFSTPETNLKIVENGLAQINIDDCHQAFNEFWKSDGYHLVLTTKQAADGATKTLLDAYNEAAKQTVEAPAARAIQVFDYTNFGAPGKIAEQSKVEDLGITQLTLSNGVRVNFKQTDFEQGKIRMTALIGSGKLTQPKNMPMFDIFAQAVFEGGGLGKHSIDDLKRILAGKNVSSSLSIEEDAFALNGSTTPEDFLMQCQIMCASLMDPGFREEALWQFRKAIPMFEQQFKHTPAGPSGRMNAWLHGGDSRYSITDAEQLSSYTIEDAKAWLTPELTQGYMELSIVGDFESNEIMPHLLSTFGALPQRSTKLPALNEARKVKFPNAPANQTFSYESKIPQAIATTVWQTMPVRGNARSFRRLNVLADILGDRLREEIREKLGASYSPGAGASGSEALENMGFIMTRSVGNPDDLDLLHRTMKEMADKLATNGATADELDRSLKPIHGQLEKSKRDNSYWLRTVMSKSQQDPERLELARTRDEDYRSITLKEINELAKRYLSAENALSISIKSE